MLHTPERVRSPLEAETPGIPAVPPTPNTPDKQFLLENAELVRLERRYEAGEVLKQHAKIAPLDGTMLRWVSGAMLRARTPETAIASWRGMASRRGRTIVDFSPAQQAVLNIPDNEIVWLHSQVKTADESIKAALPGRMAERVNGKYGHKWNDRYEQKQSPKRSLEILRERGIEIKISPEDVAYIQAEYTSESDFAILDKVKNKRIASINGLTGSKLSLSIHDIFDHFWGFDTLDKEGVLGRYASFLQSVGNPQNTDLFKREGELIGSIFYEWRSAHLPERQFKPIFTNADIARVFNKASVGRLSPNQQEAVAILENLDPESTEAKRLPAIYSGIAVELMEQRRKHGFIRRLDESFAPTGVVPILDPEYAALIVEVNHILSRDDAKAEKVLFNIEAVIEDYLVGLAQGGANETLVVTPDSIESFDAENSRLSSKRQDWLRKNLFHAATRQVMAA